MIRRLIVLAIGSLFAPSHFPIVRREDPIGNLGTLPAPEVPFSGSRRPGQSPRHRYGASAMAEGPIGRMKIPRGTYRDARGIDDSAPRTSPVKKRRRNGSRK